MLAAETPALAGPRSPMVSPSVPWPTAVGVHVDVLNASGAGVVGPPGLPPGFPPGLPPGLPPGFPPGLPPGFVPGLPPGFVPGAPPGLPVPGEVPVDPDGALWLLSVPPVVDPDGVKSPWPEPDPPKRPFAPSPSPLAPEPEPVVPAPPPAPDPDPPPVDPEPPDPPLGAPDGPMLRASAAWSVGPGDDRETASPSPMTPPTTATAATTPPTVGPAFLILPSSPPDPDLAASVPAAAAPTPATATFVAAPPSRNSGTTDRTSIRLTSLSSATRSRHSSHPSRWRCTAARSRADSPSRT